MLDVLDQSVTAWAASFGAVGEAGFRLICAAGAGAVVGLERELRGRLAGFRTNMLVCIGSALVMLVSTSLALRSWPAVGNALVSVDPARIAYGVMTGIGFLGAGTIMQAKGSIRGLTTAAALWCVAAIGMAMGFGLYVVGWLGCLLIVVVLWIMDYLEDVIPKKHYRRLVIRRAWTAGCVRSTVEQVKAMGLNVEDASFKRIDDLRNVEITLLVMYLRKHRYYELEHTFPTDGELQLVSAQE